MPKYLPFDIGISFKTSVSDMVNFYWKNRGIIADFIIPHDSTNLVRVEFDKTIVVRILDEYPLSTEEPLGEGLVPEHFAYRALGTKFWESQSNGILLIWKKAEHFRFVTGWTCLDVIADIAPRVSVVPVGQ
jgi:hypothetical protein